MDIQKTVKQPDENKSGKDKQDRTTYRNLFERVKPDEKEKIKEKINKKEINSCIEEENLKTDGK
ncbi:MAG: hypothetical protein ACYCS0_01170 [bacterium]